MIYKYPLNTGLSTVFKLAMLAQVNIFITGSHMKEIAILKKYISESKNLDEPVNYFFALMDQDKLLNIPGNRRVNDMESHRDLCVAIDAAIDIACKTLKKQISVSIPVFTEIPQEKFFHGYCIVSGHPIPLLILYCADLQVGISAVADSTSRADFFRFYLTTAGDLTNKH